MDKLAIIIPYYKFTFFEETLLSLAAQTDKRFKVYIGDDASPENPFNLIEKYKGQFDFVYHRFDENLGGISLTKQWERCIALSEDEEWLMILGDDDVLGSNVVEEFYKVDNNNCKINVIRYATIVINEEGNEKSEVFIHPVLEKATDSFFRKLSNKTRSSLSEYIFSKLVYEKYKFLDFPLAWYSDDMAWITFSECKPIITVNDALVYFRFSDQNISGRNDNKEQKEEAKFLFYDRIVQNHLDIFTVIQACVLLTTYEVLLRNRNLFNMNSFFYFIYKYLKLGKINYFIYFLKRQLCRFFCNK